MKMGAGLFWGIILIVLGLSIIIRLMFDVNVVRIVFAVVFILIGIKILIHKPAVKSSNREKDVIFGDRTYQLTPLDKAEHNTIFGKTVYDFRDTDTLNDIRTRMTFNTIFGSTDILLPPAIPVKIKTDAVFSAAMMPNGNTVAFGTANYTSSNIMNDAQLIEIEANVVFGSLNIKHR